MLVMPLHLAQEFSDALVHMPTGYAIFVLLLTAGALWFLPQIIAHKKKVDAENKLNAN